MTTRTLLEDIPVLERLFAEYERVSGLALHLGKTTLVPLFLHEELRVRERVVAEARAWGHIRITDAAEYLGFVLGPGGVRSSWEKPVAKIPAAGGRLAAVGGGLAAVGAA